MERKTKKQRKRCHECNTFIDHGKERFFLARAFCSRRCLLRAIRNELKTFLPGILSSRKISLTILLQTVNFVILIFLVIGYLQLRNRSSGSVVMVEQTPIRMDSLKLAAEPPAAMVLKSVIDIQGEADDGIILSLSVNDRLQQVTLAKNGKFHFSGIKLDEGENQLLVKGLDQAGNVVLIQRLTTRYGSPTIRFLARDFTRGDRSKPFLALTFDGGAGNGAAERILDILKQKEIRCTMFLTGAFIRRYPEMVKRMVKEGHEIGNHTWTHPHLTTFAENRQHKTIEEMTRERLQSELQKTEQAFFALTNTPMVKLWRAPFGEHNLEIRQWAAELGYRQIGWTLGKGESLDTMDWIADTSHVAYHTGEEILEKILNFGLEDSTRANGGIILMHLDTQRNEDQVHHMLPAMIDSLHQREYTVVKITDMLKR